MSRVAVGTGHGGEPERSSNAFAGVGHGGARRKEDFEGRGKRQVTRSGRPHGFDGAMSCIESMDRSKPSSEMHACAAGVVPRMWKKRREEQSGSVWCPFAARGRFATLRGTAGLTGEVLRGLVSCSRHLTELCGAKRVRRRPPALAKLFFDLDLLPSLLDTWSSL